MGKYINKTSKGILPADYEGKIQGLIEDGAVIIPVPTTFKENLVCVVDNIKFAAAIYAYDQREFDYIISTPDPRPKTWLIYEQAKYTAM